MVNSLAKKNFSFSLSPRMQNFHFNRESRFDRSESEVDHTVHALSVQCADKYCTKL